MSGASRLLVENHAEPVEGSKNRRFNGPLGGLHKCRMWKARHVRQGIGGAEGYGRALELILNRVAALRWVVVERWTP